MKVALRIVLAVLAVSTCAVAHAFRHDWDYRIQLSSDTSGLNIVARTFVGPAVTVGLENRSGKTISCSASFTSYRHAPSADETRSVTIAAGDSATLAYPAEKLGTAFSTAFVNLKCAPAKARRSN